MGWADVGCFGSKYYETPNIDRLATQGMRFTDAYAACAVCSPTRASIMTGKYPARLHLTDWIPGEGDAPSHMLSRAAVAEVPAAGGGHHRRGAQVGRLRLGQHRQMASRRAALLPRAPRLRPQRRRHAFGHPASYFWPYEGKSHTVPGLKAGGHEGEYLTDRLTDEAEKFIEQNKDRPFFLYFRPLCRPHAVAGQAGGLAKYKAKPPVGGQNNPTYAAMIESVDDSVGRILRKLETLGLADRTVVVFMSDNGGLWPAVHLERAAARRQGLSLRRRHPRAADHQVAGRDAARRDAAACPSAASISSPRSRNRRGKIGRPRWTASVSCRC